MDSGWQIHRVQLVPRLVPLWPLARFSYVCELRPGDLIFTGTPTGMGLRRMPPIYLKPGDRLISRIEGRGELINEFTEAN